jgi:hypothetical protein
MAKKAKKAAKSKPKKAVKKAKPAKKKAVKSSKPAKKKVAKAKPAKKAAKKQVAKKAIKKVKKVVAKKKKPVVKKKAVVKKAKKPLKKITAVKKPVIKKAIIKKAELKPVVKKAVIAKPENKKAQDAPKPEPVKVPKPMPSGKINKVINIQNLPSDLMEVLVKKYPDGYINHVFKVNISSETFFYAVTLDMPDIHYLIKVPVKIDSNPEEVTEEKEFTEDFPAGAEGVDGQEIPDDSEEAENIPDAE